MLLILGAIFPVPVIVSELPFLLKGGHLCARVGKSPSELTLDESQVVFLKAPLDEG